MSIATRWTGCDGTQGDLVEAEPRRRLGGQRLAAEGVLRPARVAQRQGGHRRPSRGVGPGLPRGGDYAVGEKKWGNGRK